MVKFEIQKLTSVQSPKTSTMNTPNIPSHFGFVDCFGTTIGLSPSFESMRFWNVDGYLVTFPRTIAPTKYDLTLKVNSGTLFIWERMKLEFSLEREVSPQSKRRVIQCFMVKLNCDCEGIQGKSVLLNIKQQRESNFHSTNDLPQG